MKTPKTLLLLLIVTLAGCQTHSKYPAKCTGEFTSLNPDFVYDKKADRESDRYTRVEISEKEAD